jgi:alpha-glucosidase
MAGNYDSFTLSLNATHDDNTTEYDWHNLYALGMMNATSAGVQMNNDKRPFILTRGSFSSTSRYAS